MKPDVQASNTDTAKKPGESYAGDEVTLPGSGKVFQLKQQVVDALASSPGGKELDEYFGVSSGTPKQSVTETARSDELLQKLKSVTLGESTDLTLLLGAIGDHVDGSEVNPRCTSGVDARNKEAEQYCCEGIIRARSN